MRTIQTNVYKFDELSDEAKEKAIDNLRNINMDYAWWQFTFDDAATIGLKITGFGLDRNRGAEGELTASMFEVCELIKSNHGEHCDTYKLVDSYLEQWAELVSKYSDGIKLDQVTEDNEYEFDNEADKLEEEFLRELLEEYASILQIESEYLQSDESIISTIESNGYEFTESGELV